MRAKGGLFLIPAGLLNTNHEPTAYYGVERNFVETAIIPSTWREAGVGLSSTYDNGLSWDLGLTTGFDLTKWDAKFADEPRTKTPLASIHQEGQLAKSRDLSYHAAVNWRGVPGLLVGDVVQLICTSAPTVGMIIANVRVSATDTLAIFFSTSVAIGITLGSLNFAGVAFR